MYRGGIKPTVASSTPAIKFKILADPVLTKLSDDKGKRWNITSLKWMSLAQTIHVGHRNECKNKQSGHLYSLPHYVTCEFPSQTANNEKIVYMCFSNQESCQHIVSFSFGWKSYKTHYTKLKTIAVSHLQLLMLCSSIWCITELCHYKCDKFGSNKVGMDCQSE